MYQRNISPVLTGILADTPIVAIQGPRQCGKSTLAQCACRGAYVTLDDALARSAAATSPASFLKSQGEQTVIDEVQREPGLFRELKKLVDQDRRPGRFLLTGSVNILLLPKLADSLAGRMEVLPLWPLSQGELGGTLDKFADWAFSDREIPNIEPCNDLQDRIDKGGFPEPIGRASLQRRQAWHDAYIRALLDRDVRDLADIEGLATLPRLLTALAKRPYEVLNVSALSHETGVPNTTLTRYIALLRGVFLVTSIQAWSATGSKASKTERLIFVDSGVQRLLAGGKPSIGELEAFLAMELVKQSSWSATRHSVMHFRSFSHHSVPIVLKSWDGSLVGIVVLDRTEPEPQDFNALRYLADIAGDSFAKGYVLHTGSRAQMVDQRMGVLPLSAIWQIK